jgi:DNA polymerase III epsilon subunit-like protein
MSSPQTNEAYISVDVETAGPFPREYSMLSIGACTLSDPQATFYVEIQPLNDHFTEEALRVSGLNFAELKLNGHNPPEAMSRFSDWVAQVTPLGSEPVFVAFNAPFDWMFVSDYFHRFLGRNPFGFKALDIKAFYMGMKGVPWSETAMYKVSKQYLDQRELTHHALQDALDQAKIFRKMLAEINRNS